MYFIGLLVKIQSDIKNTFLDSDYLRLLNSFHFCISRAFVLPEVEVVPINQEGFSKKTSNLKPEIIFR
jgi:hypothetical protein